MSSVVSGALFDFVAWLSQRQDTLLVGAQHEATGLTALLGEWADQRQFQLAAPDVLGWRQTLRETVLPVSFEDGGVLKCVGMTAFDSERHSQACFVPELLIKWPASIILQLIETDGSGMRVEYVCGGMLERVTAELGGDFDEPQVVGWAPRKHKTAPKIGELTERLERLLDELRVALGEPQKVGEQVRRAPDAGNCCDGGEQKAGPELTG